MKAKPPSKYVVFLDTFWIRLIPAAAVAQCLQCRKCGGTGSVFTMICGPVSANLTLL